MLKKWGAVIGFLILFSMSYWGLNGLSEVTQDNRELTVKVDYNQRLSDYKDCLNTNEARQAGHNALAKSGEREIHQALGLQKRFDESNRLNPPETPRQVASYMNGKKFFQDYVEDTKVFTAEAVQEFDEGNPQLDCVEPTNDTND